MFRVPVGASIWLRCGVLGLAATFLLTTFTIDDADARSRRKRVKKYHHSQVKKTKPARAITESSRYADIVIDAKTRKVLHQANPDALRYPASLTKVMTLYLLFEQLEAGKIKLGSQMPVSAQAASQAPTKLGLKPGQTLTVEDAIKSLVTKSANDAAVVIAEALGGTESEFARQMTRKARALGMTHTVYRNASGLPDMAQVTTARDQAILGMAIQERFPQLYRYFQTSSFVYKGRSLRNHNKLLGSVAGVDGIKTGYTNASGYNLLTSMRRADRHVVAVVLGGSTGRQRDARMRDLLSAHLMEASTTPTQRVAAAEQNTRGVAIAPVQDPPHARIGAVQEPPSAAPAAQPAQPEKVQVAAATGHIVNIKPAATDTKTAPRPGSSDPIKPVMVKTLSVKLAPAADAKTADTKATAFASETKPLHTATVPTPTSAPVPPPAKPGTLGVLRVAAASSTAAAPADRPPNRSGWAIQIGAYEEEADARQRLATAKTKVPSLLKKADPYTERTVKGDKTLYRARFAGFDHQEAETACKLLKRSNISCMALRI